MASPSRSPSPSSSLVLSPPIDQCFEELELPTTSAEETEKEKGPGLSPKEPHQRESIQSSRRARTMMTQLRRRLLGHQQHSNHNPSAFSPSSLDPTLEFEQRRRRRRLVAKLFSPSTLAVPCPSEMIDNEDDEITISHQEIATAVKTDDVEQLGNLAHASPVDQLSEHNNGALPRISSISSIDEEGNQKVCRICLGGNSISRDWVRPCRCGGTIKWVHQDCLNKWRKGGFRADSYRSCELCHTEFKIISKSLPLSFFVTRFFNNPREVLNFNLFLPSLCVYCCFLAMFVFSWAFMLSIRSFGSIILFDLLIFIVSLARQGSAHLIQMLKILLLILTFWFVVVLFGYAGKVIVFFWLRSLALFSPSSDSYETAITFQSDPSTLFTEYIGWSLNFTHFFIAASIAGSMVFLMLFAQHVFTFFRRHSHEIVLNFHPNDTRPTHQQL